MTIKTLSDYLKRLESTASRNEITEILAGLIQHVEIDEIARVSYLVMGRLGPAYESIEFNLAEKLMIRTIGRFAGEDDDRISAEYKKIGDLGETAAQYVDGKGVGELSVAEVYDRLMEIARESGEGSVDRKLSKMSLLLKELDGSSVKYTVRITLGKLRLGFSEVTFLDGLSWSETGDKSLRKDIERVYNIAPDIGRIAREFKEGGLDELNKIDAQPGVPIRTALAERLPSAEKIIEKLGEVAAEPKMDGVRMQLHLDGGREMSTEGQLSFDTFDTEGAFVKIFSRNLESTTSMFPDVVEGLQELAGDQGIESAIFDSEAIAYNPNTEEFLPFQETAQRKRKYDVEEKARELPIKVFLFDILYLNGESLLDVPFKKRRELMEEAVGGGNEVVEPVRHQVIDNVEDLRKQFDLYISEGLEGMMCKKLDSNYQSGGRNYNWVKYKRATEGELLDTIDALVMGYYRGTGKRAEFGIGAFLVGVVDAETDRIMSLAKIGTGLTDDQWREMKSRCDRLEARNKNDRYAVDSQLDCDVWLEPELIVEVEAEEITRSPVHKASQGIEVTGAGREKDAESGLALRFPRLVRFRDDRDEPMTAEEVVKLYEMQ